MIYRVNPWNKWCLIPWCIHEELEEQAKLLNNMVHKTYTYTYIYVKLFGDVCSAAWIHYRSTCLPWRFGATICLSARKTKGVIRWCPRRTTSGELVDCCLGHTGPYKLQSASNQDPIQGVNGLNNVFWNHPGRKAGKQEGENTNWNLKYLKAFLFFQTGVVRSDQSY